MNDPVLRMFGILAAAAVALAAIKQLASSSAPTFGPAAGLRTDRRWTPDRRDPRGKTGRLGFSPVKAEEHR